MQDSWCTTCCSYWKIECKYSYSKAESTINSYIVQPLVIADNSEMSVEGKYDFHQFMGSQRDEKDYFLPRTLVRSPKRGLLNSMHFNTNLTSNEHRVATGSTRSPKGLYTVTFQLLALGATPQ